jgi:AMMECR1 domain-containing protein
MRNLNRALFSSLVAAALVVGLASCRDNGPKAPTKGELQVQANAPTKVASPFPAEPLDFPIRALEGNESIPLNVEVRGQDGKEIKLSKLVSGPTLLVYIDDDTDNRQNRAATRMVRRLVREARGVGFRTIVLFTWGTETSDLATWARKRQIPGLVKLAVDHKGTFGSTTRWSPRSAALIDEAGTVGLFFGASEEWDSRLGFDGGLTSDILFRAWENPYGGPAIDAASKQSAVDLVRAALRTTWDGGKLPAALKTLASAGQLGDKLDYPAYVSLFREGSTVRLRGEHGEGTIGEAIALATRAALESAGPSAAKWRETLSSVRFSIDLSGQPTALPTRYMKSLWYLVEPGVDGVIVRRGDEQAAMIPAEPVTLGLHSPRKRPRTKKLELMFREVCKWAGLGLDDWKKDDTELLRFRTNAFGVVTPGGPATDFYRGNVLFDREPTESDLLESIKLGGRWLVGTIKDDGKFDYEYFPNLDRGSKDYNIVRHAGSVYGLFETYGMTLREEVMKEDQDLYLEGAAKTMGFIYAALGKPNTDPVGDRICLLERDRKNRCQSGSAALSLLTFLVRPEQSKVPKRYHDRLYRKDDEKLIEGLGLTLLDMIDAKGKVFRNYRQSTTMDAVKKEPLYYPGEVMLALMHLYNRTEDPRWLDGAKRIAARQIASYQRDRFQVPDHWVMQAYLHLWRATRDDRYVKSGYAMATHYSSEQYPNVYTPFPDYLGSWRRTNDTPRTTRAGSRSEALRAIVHMAWERGDDATIYEDSLLAAARHMIEQQFSVRNSYWLPNLKRADGAYRMGQVDNHCRIDNNQHMLVGMAGALEVRRKRDGQ